MAGSHVNLIITNDVVVVPIFHCESDEEAIKIISHAFPSKKVVGVYAREILMGGGNIHCMSQQEPLSDTKNGYFKKTNKRTLKNKKK